MSAEENSPELGLQWKEHWTEPQVLAFRLGSTPPGSFFLPQLLRKRLLSQAFCRVLSYVLSRTRTRPCVTLIQLLRFSRFFFCSIGAKVSYRTPPTNDFLVHGIPEPTIPESSGRSQPLPLWLWRPMTLASSNVFPKDPPPPPPDLCSPCRLLPRGPLSPVGRGLTMAMLP